MTKLAPMTFYTSNIPQLVSNIYSKVITLPIYFSVFPSQEFLTRLQMVQYNTFFQGVIYFINVIKFYSTQVTFILFMPGRNVSFPAPISQNFRMCNSIIFRSSTSESVNRNSLVLSSAAFTALFAMKHNKVLETSIHNFMQIGQKCGKYEEHFIYVLK